MYNITKATIEDIPVIHQLVDQIWRPTYAAILSPEQIEYMIGLMYNTEELSRQINDPEQQFVLLYDETQPIGFASYGTTDEKDIYKLHKIYVHPSYQGKGTGKLLLQHVIDNIYGKILELNVNRYNKAKTFYEKMGFTIHEEKDVDIGGGYFMNDFIMRKELL